MRKNLSDIRFEELKDRPLQLIHVVEMLCEICEKPLGTKEKAIKDIQIQSREELVHLLNRASIHDRAEVDFDDGKIYFYDHDFPGDIHKECVEKL